MNRTRIEDRWRGFSRPPLWLTVLAALAAGMGAAAGQDAGRGDLAGKPLRYLIGGSGTVAKDGEIVEPGYDAGRATGLAIRYGNLFDEKNCRCFGPYLKSSGTAAQYHEGKIDPYGHGWNRNIKAQLDRAKALGYRWIEWDNADSYGQQEVMGAIETAKGYGLGVIAKNPLVDDIRAWAPAYVGHPNVFGIIVERGAGSPSGYAALLKKIGRSLPVWFVAFPDKGRGLPWANSIKFDAAARGMGVTYSDRGEYGSSIDIVRPK